MTKEQVIEMLSIIKDTYQSFRVDEGVIKAWIMIFSDYECEPIMASLKKYIKTGEYCPVPASILKLYEEGKSKLNMAVGHDYEELMGILTFMLQRSDVGEEVEYYRRWTKTIPEMIRMKISAKTIAKLKGYGSKHIGEEFDFRKWLNEQNKETGD